MPVIEADLRTTLKESQLSFRSLCREIRKAHLLHEKLKLPFTLGCRSQRIVNNKWEELIKVGIREKDLVQWIIELSYYKKCTHRTALLEKTALLIETLPSLKKTNLVAIIFNLRHIEKLHTDSLIQSLVFKFLKNTINNQWLNRNQIKPCVAGLKNLPLSLSVNTFLTLIKFHIEELSAKKKWIAPTEIEEIFSSLSQFAKSPPLRKLGEVLALHIRVNNKKKRYLDSLAMEQVYQCLESSSDPGAQQELFTFELSTAEIKKITFFFRPRSVTQDLLTDSRASTGLSSSANQKIPTTSSF